MHSNRSYTKTKLSTLSINTRPVYYERNNNMNTMSTESSSGKSKLRSGIKYASLDVNKSYNIPVVGCESERLMRKQTSRKVFIKRNKHVTRATLRRMEDSIQVAKQISNRTEIIKSYNIIS